MVMVERVRRKLKNQKQIDVEKSAEGKYGRSVGVGTGMDSPGYLNAAEPKNKGGRPQAKIDLAEFEKLCNYQCTNEEIASWFGLAEITIEKKMALEPFKTLRENGRVRGRACIRRQMFQHMTLPNSAGVNAAIHLSKFYLGQTERHAIEISGQLDSNIEVTARTRVSRKIETLSERIAGRVAGIAAQAGARQVAADAE